VQKYGRTTSLTRGTIDGVDFVVNVTYTGGTARFINQIVVRSASRKGGFILAGDSGSLLVTDPDREPVGLLFAGDTRGLYGIANNIDTVLSAFSITIDGE
ncbi:MAG: hypothetical protein JXA71_02165, partial [Chitinispirillaceae bacterium]|nr:hypothetical protein [Chitinispirillaceae bacterium]